MKETNKQVLLSIGLTVKEIATLNKFDLNIEELVVLLASLHIKDIKKYLNNNRYLLTENIFSLAQNISDVFNVKKDFNETEKILSENKYAIIDKKVINNDIF